MNQKLKITKATPIQDISFEESQEDLNKNTTKKLKHVSNVLDDIGEIIEQNNKA